MQLHFQPQCGTRPFASRSWVHVALVVVQAVCTGTHRAVGDAEPCDLSKDRVAKTLHTEEACAGGERHDCNHEAAHACSAGPPTVPTTVQTIWLDAYVHPGQRGGSVSRKGEGDASRPHPPPPPPPSHNGNHAHIRTHKRYIPPTLNNTVLVLPGVLTPEECAHLRAEANRRFNTLNGHPGWLPVNQNHGTDTAEMTKRRLSLSDMDPATNEFSLAVLRERVLPELERQAPPVMQGLRLTGYNSTGHEAFAFFPREPAINRYAPGGDFSKHEDGEAMSCIILLSEDGAFEGGGTSFFPSGPAPGNAPTTVLPPQVRCSKLSTGQFYSTATVAPS